MAWSGVWTGALVLASLCGCAGTSKPGTATEGGGPTPGVDENADRPRTESQGVAGGVQEPKEEWGPWRQFGAGAGFFIAGLSSSVRLDSDRLGTGVTVDIEEALKLETSMFVWKAAGHWRISPRNKLEFAYLDLSRRGTRRIAGSYQIGDSVFDYDTRLETEFELSFYNLIYSHSFFQDDRLELAASLGIHAADIGLRFEAVDFGVLEGTDFVAPLPLIGAHGTVVVTPNLSIKQGLEFLYVRYKTFHGSLVDVNLAFEYLVWKHLAFGLGGNALLFELNAEGKEEYPGVKLNGTIEFDYLGLLLYTKLYF